MNKPGRIRINSHGSTKNDDLTKTKHNKAVFYLSATHAHGVSNHQQLVRLINHLFTLTWKRTPKPAYTGPLWRESTGGFPPQKASNTVSVSMTWPHYGSYSISQRYAYGFVVLCFVVVMQSFIMNSHVVFIHIHQGCFAGTGAIVRLPQCQWSKPGGYGKISQCITTTKHSKAKTVFIFLGIYCTVLVQDGGISSAFASKTSQSCS